MTQTLLERVWKLKALSDSERETIIRALSASGQEGAKREPKPSALAGGLDTGCEKCDNVGTSTKRQPARAALVKGS